MELHQIRYFLAVCQTLNFTRAAERCAVSQPALTRAIRNLEDELGGALIERDRRRTRLTALGEAVKPALEAVLAGTNAAADIALKTRGAARARLTVGVMCTIAPSQSGLLLKRLSARCPKTTIDVVDGDQNAVLARLTSGDLDIAFACLTGRENDQAFAFSRLYSERILVIVAAGSPLARLDAVSIRDLEGHGYIMRSHCEFDRLSQIAFAAEGVTVKTITRSNRDDWIEGMVAAGMGYGFFPERSIRHPGVVARPLVSPTFSRDVGIVTLANRPVDTLAARLSEEVGAIEWETRREYA